MKFYWLISISIFLNACTLPKDTIELPVTLLEQQLDLLFEATSNALSEADAKMAYIKEERFKKDFFPLQDSLYNVLKAMFLDCDLIDKAFAKAIKNELSITKLDIFAMEFKAQKDSLLEKYRAVLQYGYTDVPKHQISEKIAYFEKQISIEMLLKWNTNNTELNRIYSSQLYFQIAQMRYRLIRQMELDILGCNRFYFEEIHPIVHTPSSTCIQQGDSSTVFIGLGSFMDIRSSDFFIIINEKDTLSMDTYIEDYRLNTNQKGMHKLSIEANIRNPLTGKYLTRGLLYEYEVQ